MSINLLYEISRRGLQASSGGINTAGQNIANVETEGYTRRRLTFQANDINANGVGITLPIDTPRGSGVSISSFERMRDTLLTKATWESQSAMGASQEEARLLGTLEGLFATGSDGSLTNVVKDYWNAWSDVTDSPTDLGVRNALLQRAESLTGTFNRLGKDIEYIRDETKVTIQDGVKEANKLLAEIANLNVTIREARFEGAPAFNLEDRRDLAVKELANLVPVKVQDNNQGYMVTINGMIGVQGEKSFGLEYYQTNAQTVGVRFQDTPVDLGGAPGEDGQIGAWIRTHNVGIGNLTATLDTFVSDLVTQTNTIHASGFDLNGVAGGNFFDNGGTTMTSFRVQLTDPKGVAAAGGTAGPPVVSLGAGDNTRARQLSNLRKTYEDQVIDVVSDVGAEVNRVTTISTSNAAVADHLESMESGISSVSLDEEMTNLIRFQQSYAASAKLLSTVEEMMDTLLSL